MKIVGLIQPSMFQQQLEKLSRQSHTGEKVDYDMAQQNVTATKL